MSRPFKGRKFGRERDQREALISVLSTQLIKHGSIRTTLAKAKELRPHVEKLVTLAKKETLAARRLVIARLDNNVTAGHRLFDVIVPSTGERSSGYLRIQKNGFRKGDNASMAVISFVDEITEPKDQPEPKLNTPAKAPAKIKPAVKKVKS
jgi:large subunit ribosomal protein L17